MGSQGTRGARKTGGETSVQEESVAQGTKNGHPQILEMSCYARKEGKIPDSAEGETDRNTLLQDQRKGLPGVEKHQEGGGYTKQEEGGLVTGKVSRNSPQERGGHERDLSLKKKENSLRTKKIQTNPLGKVQQTKRVESL